MTRLKTLDVACLPPTRRLPAGEEGRGGARQGLRTVAKQRWAVVVDFDGTITLRDIADAILLHYTSISFKDVHSSYDPDTVTENWVREKFRAVKATEKELLRFIHRVGRLRPGFKSLLLLCQKKKIPIEIVSGGLDFYIHPLLRRWGLEKIKVHCAQAKCGSKGWDVHYRYLNGSTLDKFKAKRVVWHKKRGFKVLFAGDGGSDLEAAKKADSVFARGTLLRLCRKYHVPAKPFKNFNAVLNVLRDLKR
ncbi:MAG: HAD-IB family phosphatase [Elusimicrobia bacterium]|nr:HAD-IB family phosphatase [Elusimicrobiota bacterium]